jgi:hypothetical protein
MLIVTSALNPAYCLSPMTLPLRTTTKESRLSGYALKKPGYPLIPGNPAIILSARLAAFRTRLTLGLAFIAGSVS